MKRKSGVHSTHSHETLFWSLALFLFYALPNLFIKGNDDDTPRIYWILSQFLFMLRETKKSFFSRGPSKKSMARQSEVIYCIGSSPVDEKAKSTNPCCGLQKTGDEEPCFASFFGEIGQYCCIIRLY